MDAPPVCILPNPDISGLGVRIAIYVQNILSFAPAAIALWDGEVSADELKGMEGHSVGMLAIAFAILITTIIQAKSSTDGINAFHAAVVLDLSWMNNTTTFIWFLLYAYHRGQFSSQTRPPLPATFPAWVEELFSPFRVKRHRTQPVRHPSTSDYAISRFCPSFLRRPARWVIWAGNTITRLRFSLRSFYREDLVDFIKQLWTALSSNIVLVMGSLHLTLMAAVGLWMWSHPFKFGGTLSCDPSLAIVGVNVHFSSPALRILSLLIYSIFLIPGLNLIIPFLVFLTPHIVYNRIRGEKTAPADVEATAGTTEQPVEKGMKLASGSNDKVKPSKGVDGKPLELSREDSANGQSNSNEPRPALLYGGLVFLLLVNIVFLLDVELTLIRNKDLQESTEAVWGFGQVLALLLLSVPIREFISSLVRIRNQAEEQRRRVEDEARRLAEERQKQFDDLVALALSQDFRQVRFNDYGFLALLEAGVNPNTVVEGKDIVEKKRHKRRHMHEAPKKKKGHFVTLLQMASRSGNVSLVEQLLQFRADPQLGASSLKGPAIYIAAKHGRGEIVQLLLRSGADQKLVGPKGTALHIAALQGHKEICVKDILDRVASEADPDLEGNCPLHIAAEKGFKEIVRALLDSGANVDLVGDLGRQATALHIAAEKGFKEIVQALLDSGADVNLVGPQGTALHVAASYGREGIVQRILAFGVAPDQPDGEGITALHFAAYYGHAKVVRLLVLRHKVEINVQCNEYGTPLQAAATGRNDGIAAFLLKHGADPNLHDLREPALIRVVVNEDNPVLVKALLDRGADINYMHKGSGTALTCAAYHQRFESIQLLLDRKANPNVTGGPYHTALQAACTQHHRTNEIELKIVRMLIEAGADPRILGGWGGSALKTATNKKKPQTAEVLRTKLRELGVPESELWPPVEDD